MNEEGHLEEAFEVGNEEEGYINFGIGSGIKPKEFPAASPGGLVTNELQGSRLHPVGDNSSMVMMKMLREDTVHDRSVRESDPPQYQSLTQRENEIDRNQQDGHLAVQMLGRSSNRMAMSHEKKFIAFKNGARQQQASREANALPHHHEQMSVSSLSSIFHGTPKVSRDHDSILNDSMATPPSRQSSMHMAMDQNVPHGFYQYGHSPSRGQLTEKRLHKMQSQQRCNQSRLDGSFYGSESHLTPFSTKHAQKEQRIEKYKEQVYLLNGSYEQIKDRLSIEQEKLSKAQQENQRLRQMVNFMLQQTTAASDQAEGPALLL